MVHWFGEPLGPFFDVGGVGGAGDGGGNIGIDTGKLEGELGDVDVVVFAEFGGLASGVFDFFGFFEPVGEGGIGEEASGEGASVDGTDLFVFESREEGFGKVGVL